MQVRAISLTGVVALAAGRAIQSITLRRCGGGCTSSHSAAHVYGGVSNGGGAGGRHGIGGGGSMLMAGDAALVRELTGRPSLQIDIV